MKRFTYVKMARREVPARGLVVCFDTFMSEPNKGLAARVFIYNNRTNMRRAIARVLGKDRVPDRTAWGQASSLRTQIIGWHKDGTEYTRWELDPDLFACVFMAEHPLPRYFTEILAHELTHAAIFYAERVRRTIWTPEARNNSDEAICYPAGRLISEAVHYLRGKGLHYGR